MFFQSKEQVKAHAKSLLKSLRHQAPALTLGHVLDALSAAQGYADWNVYSATLSDEGITENLSDFERAHAHDAAECDLRAEETGQRGYGPECVVQVHTGFYLVAPAYPQELDYLRVCDPLGREIAYWNVDEVVEDPADVLGALVGALCRGTSAKLPYNVLLK